MALSRLSAKDFSNITSLATGLYNIHVIRQHGSERIILKNSQEFKPLLAKNFLFKPVFLNFSSGVLKFPLYNSRL
jgi:hypothetical protein